MDPVLGAELLVKMAHVQVKVLLPVKPQHLLGLRQWHTLLAWPAAPPVDQSVVAVLFIALSPTPHLSVADAELTILLAACHQLIFFPIARRRSLPGPRSPVPPPALG